MDFHMFVHRQYDFSWLSIVRQNKRDNEIVEVPWWSTLWQSFNWKTCNHLIYTPPIQKNNGPSAITHRRRQNVVKISVTQSPAARVPLPCFYHILTSSVSYYWTEAQQHGIYLLTRSYANRELIFQPAASFSRINSLLWVTFVYEDVYTIWISCNCL